MNYPSLLKYGAFGIKYGFIHFHSIHENKIKDDFKLKYGTYPELIRKHKKNKKKQKSDKFAFFKDYKTTVALELKQEQERLRIQTSNKENLNKLIQKEIRANRKEILKIVQRNDVDMIFAGIVGMSACWKKRCHELFRDTIPARNLRNKTNETWEMIIADVKTLLPIDFHDISTISIGCFKLKISNSI